MDIASLARPEIVAMQPYASARSSMSADGILLNANEAPLTLLEDADLEKLALNRYPSPQPDALSERLAALYGVSRDRLLITRGSDEGIDLLLRVFCRAGVDRIIECTPCFGMYRVAAAIQGAGVTAVPRLPEQGFSIDVETLCRTVEDQPGVRLVFLTSPNNPTGDGLEAADLDRILAACEGRALVVLDEAYIEFSPRESAARKVGAHPHLVVLRTLSKAWAAAALRCGAVIADPAVIDLLQRIMAPYPLATPAVNAALRVTDASVRPRQTAMIESVFAEKAAFLQFLETLPWVRQIWPGEANFILARVDAAGALSAWCEQHDIRIRNFDGQPMLDGCVRFTMGTREEMLALTRALKRYGRSS